MGVEPESVAQEVIREQLVRDGGMLGEVPGGQV